MALHRPVDVAAVTGRVDFAHRGACVEPQRKI